MCSSTFSSWRAFGHPNTAWRPHLPLPFVRIFVMRTQSKMRVGSMTTSPDTRQMPPSNGPRLPSRTQGLSILHSPDATHTLLVSPLPIRPSTVWSGSSFLPVVVNPVDAVGPAPPTPLPLALHKVKVDRTFCGLTRHSSSHSPRHRDGPLTSPFDVPRLSHP